MANEKFIIDGERVIQQSPDGTYKEVTLQTDKDNNVVTSDGIILDENNTIEASFPITDKLVSEPGYRMPFHGSFITFSGRDLYGSFKELQQKESEFRDPSENFLNNLTAGFIGLAKQGIIKGLGQVGQLLFGKPGTGSLMSKLKTLANMPRKDLAKKLGQEVVKGGISLGVDTAVDAASKAATGKTVGEHTANVLSTVTGLDVPTWVGDLASPTQWIGYNSLNKIERELLPFLPGRYNQTIPGKVFPQKYLKATIRENGINYVPTQTSIDQAINHMGKDAQFVVTDIEHTGLVKPTEMLKETKEAAKETMKRLKKEGAYVPWNFRFRDDLYEWLPLEYTYYDKNGISQFIMHKKHFKYGKQSLVVEFDTNTGKCVHIWKTVFDGYKVKKLKDIKGKDSIPILYKNSVINEVIGFIRMGALLVRSNFMVDNKIINYNAYKKELDFLKVRFRK